MLKRAGPIVLSLLVALVAVTPLAKATLLAPGGVGAPGVFDFTGHTMTLQLGGSASGSFLGSTGTPTGLWSEKVYLDSGPNAACLTGGCLDFLINLTVSTGEVHRITASSFAGALTDVGFVGVVSSPFFTMGLTPNAVNRSTILGDGGATVGFDFLLPGMVGGSATPTSATLVILTNSTTFVPGTLSLIDSGTVTVKAFGTAVEPASALLLGVSLLMGGIFRKKLFA